MITRTKKNQLPRCLYILAMAAFLLFSFVSRAPAPVVEDPLVGFHYELDVQGIIAGYFTEVSGIGSENEIVEQKVVTDKGVYMVRRIPGTLKWSDVTLKRGITANKDIWTWRKMVEDGNVVGARKNFSIILYDQTYRAVAQWDFKNGWPSKIEAPAATSTTAAVEAITIAHEGMERVQ
jgi:phage tail-like protein